MSQDTLTAPATEASPAKGETPWSKVTQSALGEPGQNRTGQQLAAELSQKRRARLAADSGQTTGTQPKGPASTEPADASAAETVEATDETQAASAPEGTEAEATGTDDSGNEAATEGDGTEGQDDPKAPKAVRELEKRLKKSHSELFALREEAKTKGEEVETLRSRVAALETGQVSEAQAVSHPELAPIDKELKFFQDFLAWAQTHPDGGKFEHEGQVVHENIQADQLPGLMSGSQIELSKLAGTRAAKVERLKAEYADQVQKGWSDAKAVYPWLDNKATPEHRKASEVVNSLPAPVRAALNSMPNSRLLLGHLVTGLLANEAKSGQKPPAPTPRGNPPKVISSATSQSPKGGPGSDAKRLLSEAEAAYAKSGSAKDLSRMTSLKRLVQRTSG